MLQFFVAEPSSQPTHQPSARPRVQPSEQPSVVPSGQPSNQPSSQPSLHPTAQPSSSPVVYISSEKPSVIPTCSPTTRNSHASLPSSRSISILHSNSNPNSLSKLKIVLPFSHISVVEGDGFMDIKFNSDSSSLHGVNYVLFGSSSLDHSQVLSISLSYDDGFVVMPAISYDFSGRSVSIAGEHLLLTYI
jgi:hypothetical protein